MTDFVSVDVNVGALVAGTMGSGGGGGVPGPGCLGLAWLILAGLTGWWLWSLLA